MNNLLYALIGIIAFLTGNYLLLIVIPVMMWTFKDEAKKKTRAVFVRTRSRITKSLTPVFQVYSFDK